MLASNKQKKNYQEYDVGTLEKYNKLKQSKINDNDEEALDEDDDDMDN